MNEVRSAVYRLTVLLGILAAGTAQAASLQKVNDWGASGVPPTASMFIYVPDKLATKPPVLVVAHYCGGTASAVFGQAQGGGIVKAADMHGFIMVLPQTSKNCWDVGSTNALTHDGGGDTQAVAQMVKYALTTYRGNPDRVYITGDSSGGMLTEAMLAVYPDLFKGGSAFAGVPAGCWAAGNPDGSWSGQCAGGQVSHSGAEWANLARGMYPSYQGHRPRVQLFHGDADSIINFKNHSEGTKQWITVLGLSADPSSTDSVTLGTHQATRQRWKNDCGYVVLEAYTSKGGDHGPSDALFNASYVIPFLGLDTSGPSDPQIAACDKPSGVMGGTGGAVSGTADAAMAGAPSHDAGSASVVDGGLFAGDGGSTMAATLGGAGGATTNTDPGHDAEAGDGCSCSLIGSVRWTARAFAGALLGLFILRRRRPTVSASPPL